MVERNYRMVKRWIAGYIRIYKKCLMQQGKMEYIRLFGKVIELMKNSRKY